jgi:acyl-CoA synthetase (NDP forming)
MAKRDNLDCFFSPRSIAVVGASPDRSKLSNIILKSLKNAGFRGDIYPVNPKYASVEGLACHNSLDEIKSRPSRPGRVDLTVFAMPAASVVDLVKEFHHKLRGIVIISGGFAESGLEGAALEKELKGLARKHSLRIIGPNCLGIYDTVSRVDTFFVPGERLKRPGPGSLAIISQSGSFAVIAMDVLADEGIGVSRIVSYGNTADVNESDCIEFLANDERTSAIALYIESVQDGKRFVKAAAACTKKKPVMAIKVGRSGAASSAARSHTGAIAGRYELYRAAFKKAGIIELRGYEDFLSGCKALAMQRPARGTRVMVITDGGGIGVSIADACSDEGLDVAPLTRETAARLESALPNFCTALNPLDLTGSATDELFAEALEKTLSEDHYDMAIVAALWGPPALTDNLAKLMAEKARSIDKPVIICSPGGEYTRSKKDLFMNLGLPVFGSPESAVRAASVLAKAGKTGGKGRAGLAGG